MDDTELRDPFVAEIRSRLIGPVEAKEVLHEKPHKRYLSGMIFPQGATAGKNIADEHQDGEDPSMDEDEDEDAPESPTDMLFQKLPASVGMTFALEANEQKLTVHLRAAAYSKGKAEVVAVSADRRKRKGPPVVWTRRALPSGSDVETVVVDLPHDGARTREPIRVLEGMAELRVYVRFSGDARIATVALVNRNQTAEEMPVNAEHILF